jgi:L-ascorbate metabolism protein UlaG (beta-lactamase superfamily)
VSQSLLLAPLVATAVILAAFAQPRDAEGRFVNLDGQGAPGGLGRAMRVFLWDRLTGKGRPPPPGPGAPSVAPDLALLATPPLPGEPARVTWLGHAGFLVQLDGVSLLVDPALGPSIGPDVLGVGRIERQVPPGVPAEKLPPIDAVLVSHSHYDHLDLPTLERVGAPVVGGLGMERFCRERHLFATELGWWQTTTVRGLRVTFVPSHHWSRRSLFDTNRMLWGGFVIEGSAATLYHSGDSAWFEGFKEIGARFPGIDAALLPIGAYEPADFMQTMHLSPESALRAFGALGAGTFVAMHWGTFRLAWEPFDEPPRRLEAERARLGIAPGRVRVPAVGETLVVGRDAGQRAAASSPP